MESIATETAVASASKLQESVLGATVLILLLVITYLINRFFKHIQESDNRWNDAVRENTRELSNMAQSHRETGDKIANSIERALISRGDK